jgi:hypothetical protein
LQPVPVRRDGLFAAARQRQDAGQVAKQLDFQSPFLGYQPHLIDQFANEGLTGIVRATGDDDTVALLRKGKRRLLPDFQSARR